MPSRDFAAHLREASTSPDRYLYLSNVEPHQDFDGSISFDFLPTPTQESVKLVGIVTTRITDTHDYPNNHDFVVWVECYNKDPDPAITNALEKAKNDGVLHGVTIHEFLTEIQDLLFTALNKDSNARREDDEPDNLSDGFDFHAYDSDWPGSEPGTSSRFCPARLSKKMRSDLHTAKAGGFRIGHLGDTSENFILSLSCRIARLEISEDCMLAWHVKPKDYFVLLIRYPRGYLNMQNAFELGDPLSSWIQMRVGLCESYKPSFKTAAEAFDGMEASDILNSGGPSFQSSFISGPLGKLLNERFLPILKIRKENHCSWTSAEIFCQSSQGTRMHAQDAKSPEYQHGDGWSTSAPAMLQTDHFAEGSLDPAKASLPLVAMQFTLRHFIKCNEFCLVCHCKTFAKFESVKPYVCSNGLCLYQYITFGMGSNLEHAIRNEPMVVDLLVSLLYASAAMNQLEDFPVGLGLKVPNFNGKPSRENLEFSLNLPSDLSINSSPEIWKVPNAHAGTLDPSCLLLTGVDLDMAKLLPGTWLTFGLDLRRRNYVNQAWSCQITEAHQLGQYAILNEPITWGSVPFRNHLPFTSHDKAPIKFFLHEADFDDLQPENKRSFIRMQLNSLPDVNQMRQYLIGGGSDRNLSSWNEITPAALNILRWVIASNRSSIMQDHQVSEHLVTGMDGFIQFRLAQGAPDKEHRFMQAINAYSRPVNPEYPTIFAWHGSAIHKWHGILREGLNFKKITHGRASGDGVYFSSTCSESLSFSRNRHWDAFWPNSALDMREIVSLNELVNRPDMFHSISPHFVVQELDLIQPRYLFVGTEPKADKPQVPLLEEEKNLTILPQDPRYPAKGPLGKPIMIPFSAISHRRRQAHYKTEKFSGESNLPMLDLNAPPQTNDDHESVSTCEEDLTFLISDDEMPEASSPEPSKALHKPAAVLNKTAYKPGTLIAEELPLFAGPESASRFASQTLQRHLQAVLKTQGEEPLHELGWYVDPNLIQNMYQWIVELHSFDNDLPLAADLRQQNLQSIVLEMRFSDDFPMNPPFVRVIRPRFLDFAQGGGGHVTHGGAMCMELLTNTGWSAVASIESVLLQVRMAICSIDPRPARLCRDGRTTDYGINEAIVAYKRACLIHGWKVPPGLDSMPRK